MKPSYLITGGTGTFGRAFVKHLLENDLSERICVLSRNEHSQADMRRDLNDDPRLRWFIACVRDFDAVRRAMNKVSVVVHAAALKRIEVAMYNPLEVAKTNVGGTENVVAAAHDMGVKKAVLISSDKACFPISAYGATKLVAEQIFMAADQGFSSTKYAVCRYGNVWCSNGSVVPRWLSMIEAGAREVTVTDPDCTRFFMHAHEAVDLVMRTLKGMKGGELSIPSLPAYRLGDLVEAMGVGMQVTGLPDWEKKHEAMAIGNTSDIARRMDVDELREELAKLSVDKRIIFTRKRASSLQIAA